MTKLIREWFSFYLIFRYERIFFNKFTCASWLVWFVFWVQLWRADLESNEEQADTKQGGKTFQSFRRPECSGLAWSKISKIVYNKGQVTVFVIFYPLTTTIFSCVLTSSSGNQRRNNRALHWFRAPSDWCRHWSRFAALAGCQRDRLFLPLWRMVNVRQALCISKIEL